MTDTSSRRFAIAALIAVLAFGVAFAAHKASTGGTQTQALPVPAVLSSTPVHVSGVALPATTVPALHRPPRPAAPARSTPAPSSTPSAPAPAAPSSPATPPSGGGGGGGGPVIVG